MKKINTRYLEGISEDAGGKPSNKRLISIWGFVLLTIAFCVELWIYKIIRIEFLYIVGAITGATILGITTESVIALYQMYTQGGGGWWSGIGNSITQVFKKKPTFDDELPRGTYSEDDREIL